MIVAESPRPHECLRVVVASLLEVELEQVPWPASTIDDDTWQATWAALVEWLARRGWHLLWREVDAAPFDEWLEGMAGSVHYVVASVQHPSWGEWAHAIVTRGVDVVLWPPTGTVDPPLDELALVGVGLLVPIDPAAFELVRQVVELEPEVAGAYVFRAGRHLEHLVDVDDEARAACGLELAGVQLVVAGAHRRCRWCELSGRGRLLDLAVDELVAA